MMMTPKDALEKEILRQYIMAFSINFQMTVTGSDLLSARIILQPDLSKATFWMSKSCALSHMEKKHFSIIYQKRLQDMFFLHRHLGSCISGELLVDEDTVCGIQLYSLLVISLSLCFSGHSWNGLQGSYKIVPLQSRPDKFSDFLLDGILSDYILLFISTQWERVNFPWSWQT